MVEIGKVISGDPPDPANPYRIEGHRHFDRLWKGGVMSRSRAYKWLAKQLDITTDECHFSLFDIEMCQKAIDICQEAWAITHPEMLIDIGSREDA